MASRRVRIKGIANIPQRRKPGHGANEIETPEQKDTDNNKKEETIIRPNLNKITDSHVNEDDVNDKENEITSNVKSNVILINVIGQANNRIDKNETNSVNTEAQVLHFKDEVLPQENNDITENSIQENVIVNSIDSIKCIPEKIIQTSKVPTARRKFLKPPVSVNILNRKPKEKIPEVNPESNQENEELVNIILNEVEIISKNSNSSVLIQKTEVQTRPHIPKLEYIKDPIKSGSDTEYQYPPASPTKILNRRIKAVPKLHQRRTSFSIGSASESEDDSRRSYSRIRNDSVCSATSGINEGNPSIEAISPTRKEFTVVPRKCRRNDQARKLAEARREFNLKFGNGKPDKQKLTMIDLIFYNPATNPMSSKKRKRQNTSTSEASDVKSTTEDKADEEKADDPQPLSDSDNDVPAPQIKVGPNGEIIVDEKSLVIENAETKRGREALQMSELVNGDDDTSYGIYKRVRRSKEWSKEETLRFYKALNTIGTDFTIMGELFPNRTRRELKMKFKKEERLNQSLINKAVMQPIEFDMTELRKDLELEEKKAAETIKRVEETKVMKANAIEKKKYAKKMEKIKGIDTFTKVPEKLVKKLDPVIKQKKTPYEAIKKGIDSLLSESDEDDNLCESEIIADENRKRADCNNEGDSDSENVSNILKPTRYGRIPRPRLQDTSQEQILQSSKRRKIQMSSDNDPKSREYLEPGSIMIVKSKTPSDQVVYKVYIVTDNQTKQQINLEPQVLQNLTEMGVDRSAEIENQLCDIQADNILTISAQEFSGDIEQNNQIVNVSNISDEKQLNEQPTIDFKNTQLTDNLPILSCSNGIEISNNSIIFPFDEYLTSTVGNQNITVSHEDNKMTVVTENNKKCVLTT